MSQADRDDTNHEKRLQAALVEYLEIVESGRTPDRGTFLARYPDIESELSEFLSNHELIDEVVSPLRRAVDGGPGPITTGRETLPPDGAGTPPVGKMVRYFGNYELLEEIARGGMGVVYKARQSSLKRIVALKMILSGHLAGEEAVTRFYVEAEAAAKLDHPWIVPIFEIGQHEGQHYFSMAFVKGINLAHKIVDGPLPPHEAAQLMKKIAEAIAYAHIEGVVHRDLKPANVIIDEDGDPRVTDFGLAKRIFVESLSESCKQPVANLTETGQVLGTPSYMPPEQAAGNTEKIGPLSDVYSLGAILYCLLTGRPPFQAASTTETLIQVLHQEPVSPTQLNPDVPRDLETICIKCLQKDPFQRIASAQELAKELSRFLAGEPIEARPIGRVARIGRWCARHPARASLIFSSMVLFVILLAASISQYSAWQERLYLQYAEVDFVVETKGGQMTATIGNVTMVFEGITDARDGISQGKLPVRGGQKHTIEMNAKGQSNRGETGPTNINLMSINDYEFILDYTTRRLHLQTPHGMQSITLKQDTPLTIWIATDGTFKLK